MSSSLKKLDGLGTIVEQLPRLLHVSDEIIVKNLGFKQF